MIVVIMMQIVSLYSISLLVVQNVKHRQAAESSLHELKSNEEVETTIRYLSRIQWTDSSRNKNFKYVSLWDR